MSHTTPHIISSGMCTRTSLTPVMYKKRHRNRRSKTGVHNHITYHVVEVFIRNILSKNSRHDH